MKPLRIRIDRIVDFGTVVSLVGVDTGTAMPVTIHIDHRPFAAFWEAWSATGFPQPIEYEAAPSRHAAQRRCRRGPAHGARQLRTGDRER
jgi:hypothetical protein